MKIYTKIRTFLNLTAVTVIYLNVALPNTGTMIFESVHMNKNRYLPFRLSDRFINNNCSALWFELHLN